MLAYSRASLRSGGASATGPGPGSARSAAFRAPNSAACTVTPDRTLANLGGTLLLHGPRPGPRLGRLSGPFRTGRPLCLQLAQGRAAPLCCGACLCSHVDSGASLGPGPQVCLAQGRCSVLPLRLQAQANVFLLLPPFTLRDC